MYSARNKKKELKNASCSKIGFISGFTLVELVIVVVIMMLVFGAGMANMRGFQRRRVLDSATSRIVSHLRLAQQLAMSGAKPSSCTGTLEGVLFVRLDGTRYNIVARCRNGAVEALIIINPSPYNLLPDYANVSYTLPGSSVSFNTLGRGVVEAKTITLTHSDLAANPRTITITTGGEINVN